MSLKLSQAELDFARNEDTCVSHVGCKRVGLRGLLPAVYFDRYQRFVRCIVCRGQVR